MALRRRAFDDPFGYGVEAGAGDYQDPAPPTGMPGTQTNPNTGVAGASTEPAQTPQWSPGAKAGQDVTLLGFDTGKLSDPNYATDKYSSAAKAFYGGLKQDVGLSRGGLDNMIKYLQGNGFQNARAVGDDRIDFGDGAGPVDVIRSDGQIVFQNTFGNPAWEGQHQDLAQQHAAGNAAALGYPGGAGGGVGGGAGGGGGYYSSRPAFDSAALKDALTGLFPNGAFNQDIVNRRVDNVKGALAGARKSRLATNKALLADRGLIGSGPEMTAYQNMDEDLFNREVSGINEAYATESDAASQRMMQALQIAAGMTAEEARNAVDWFRAQSDASIGHERNANDLFLGNRNADLGFYRAGNDFALGQGGLAIDNMNGVNNYNLGLGRLGLDRDALQGQLQGADLDRLLRIVEQLHGGAQTSAGGYR